MKNKFVFSASLAVLFISVLGCSFYNPLEGSSNSAAGDNRTLSDKAIDSTVGESKIGVPESDEIFNFFADQAKSPDDDFVLHLLELQSPQERRRYAEGDP